VTAYVTKVNRVEFSDAFASTLNRVEFSDFVTMMKRVGFSDCLCNNGEQGRV
jgi:hypothetical protein